MPSIRSIKVYAQETIDWLKQKYPNLATFIIDKGGGWVISAGSGYTLHEVKDTLEKNKKKHDVEHAA